MPRWVPLFLDPPLPTQKGGQGSVLDASLHCAPKEGRVLLKPPKQARDGGDNVFLVLQRAMSSRCLGDQGRFLRGERGSK